MKSFSPKRVILSALLVGLICTSCIGPFNATRRLHTWNREFDNRWVGEAVFLVLRWVPVYLVFTVSDLLIWNSIEFWGGTNPIDPVNPERIKALNDADDERAGIEPEVEEPPEEQSGATEMAE